MKNLSTLCIGLCMLLGVSRLAAQSQISNHTTADNASIVNQEAGVGVFKGSSINMPSFRMSTDKRKSSENSNRYYLSEVIGKGRSSKTLSHGQDRYHSDLISVDLRLENEDDFFFKNRRNRYSALWAFASLNYLYADLIGLMDKNMLLQFQTGTVNGIDITPNFLTAAAGFMQIPLANVLLPQVIKNERTLKWVQIASGTVMSIVQASTLFVGKPAPYYVVFSAIEIGTTAYITFDAIKWKAKKRRSQKSKNG